MRRWGEIRDPIHGYIFITDVERELIDTRPIQRLRGIKQLAGAHLTYPGGEHSRFSHSLGVMHLAGVLANRLVQLEYLSQDDMQKARIAGLLHDVGHGPFSHMYEEVLEKYRHMTHEDVAQWLIKKSEVKDVLKKNGYSPAELSKLSVGRLEKTEKPFLNQIIAGQFDVDIMDYLVRDSYFTGVEYGKVDIYRLIDSMDVIDEGLGVDLAASYALEAFVIARYEMFKAVYYHRSVRAAEVMLIRAMDYANEKLGLTAFKAPEGYLQLDDASVLLRLLSLKGAKEKPLKSSYEIARMFVDRQLFKCAYESIIHRRDEFFTSILNRGEIRRQIAQEMSDKTGVDPNFIYIDVPTVPSVPYYPMQKRQADIPVFQTLPSGSKSVQRLSEVSHLVETLMGYMDVIRVYTAAPYRKKIQEVAEQIFSEGPYSTRVSF